MPMDVAVIGAGIVGLAHAWSASERGHRVTVHERHPRAMGASVRNFGMIWPIGQLPGSNHALALRSRSRWLRLATESGIWANPCGSIHLAHQEDEWEVLREFASKATDLGYDCELLAPRQIMERTPAANPDQLHGGLFSPTEVCVDPREAIRVLPSWLAQKFGVRFNFGREVTAIEDRVVLSAGTCLGRFDRILICPGDHLTVLVPEALREGNVKLCKLQMLKIASPGVSWLMGPLLASGLTMRYYDNFSICPSVRELKQRITRESPELDAFGIHVLASQNQKGEVLLGDSHEYGDSIDPFDKASINDLILRELRRVLRLPAWNIVESWHGIYAKTSPGPMFHAEPEPNVHLCTGLGGAGMTLAFGLAEQQWDEWEAIGTAQ